ncbi:MAG: hypothetical protein GF398_05365 [Chitinivibrionales bacterium]|nr:hypothetical protein [Chitinivibrionales bacterium]
MRLTTVLLAALPALCAICTVRADISYPAGSGVVNITKHPYSADNSGSRDVTSIIQRALDENTDANRIIYFPAGTYLVSNTLKWGEEQKRTTIEGQTKAKTVIRLKDNADGYQDVHNRKAMIWTGDAPAQRFRNSIRNITLNSGRGNSGACGIQYNTSNQGHMMQVNIVSGDLQGHSGIDMGFTAEIGPCLIRDVYIKGFNYGVYTIAPMNGQTFENLTVEHQQVAGVYNLHQPLTIRGFTSRNSVPALVNDIPATTTIVDGELIGLPGAGDRNALWNKSSMFVRDVRTSGYYLSIRDDGELKKNHVDPYIDEYISTSIASRFLSPQRTLNLTIEDAPEIPRDPHNQWVSPMAYGAVGDGSTDDTKAIQAAFNAGKSTVYFNGGKVFKFGGTVTVPASIRRVIGVEGRLAGSGAFELAQHSSQPIIFHQLDAIYSSVELIHSTQRTLIIRGVTGLQYVNGGNAGTVFMEDYGINELRLSRQTVYMRQINCESNQTKIVNDGGTVWILGMKTEREGTLVETRNGGTTEILGCFSYATGGAKTTPMYRVDKSSFSLAGQSVVSTSVPWKLLVEETRGSLTRSLESKAASGDTVQVSFGGYAGYQDTVKPQVLRITSLGSANRMSVHFSKPLDPASLQYPSSFALSNGASVDSAWPNHDFTAAILRTTGLSEGVSYTLTMNALRDLLKINTLAPSTSMQFRHTRIGDDFAVNELDSGWRAHNTNGAGSNSYRLRYGYLELYSRHKGINDTASEFAGVIRNDLRGDFDVRVEVLDIRNTDTRAVGGIIAGNRLDSYGAGGMVAFGVTASNGYVLQWDARGAKGILENTAAGGTTKFPCWLRLKRTGMSYQAYYSDDDTASWNAFKSPVTPQDIMSAEGDLALFSSNYNTFNTGCAKLDNFSGHMPGVTTVADQTAGPAATSEPAVNMSRGSMLISVPWKAPYTITLYSLSGRMLTALQGSKPRLWSIPLHRYGNGIYLARIQAGAHTRVYRMVMR